ncbi:Murein DD-endopeptidase MepM [bacterium HR40]|nr:Murein DD-endopeptidase MepM [bacterium HR40]
MYVQPYHSLGRALAFVAAAAFSLGVVVGALAVWFVLGQSRGGESAAVSSHPWRVQSALPEPSRQPATSPAATTAVLASREPASAPTASVAAAPGEADGAFRTGGGDAWPESLTFAVDPAIPLAPPARTERLLLATRTERVEQQVEIRRGDTLLSILLEAGVGTAEAHEAISTLRGLYDLRRLQPGQYLTLALERERRSGGELRLASLSFALDARKEVELSRDDEGHFVVRAVEREFAAETRLATGAIEDSLYAAALRQSVPESTLAEAIRLLSWDIDFQRDLQPEDRFELLYEELVHAPSGASLPGDLLYLALRMDRRIVEAFRFKTRDGQVQYYDRQGRSLRKSLLKTPVDGARLSSRFGNRRHPVLGYTRMHKGVDFAAPTGTPIYAAGDGVVVMAGPYSAYGNYVRIRHTREFETAYGHMSRIATGIRSGVRVRQGQVIGYVGSTGMSTGPHLHYEVLQAGRQVNPLRVTVTVAEQLEGRDLEAFRQRVADIDGLRRRLGEAKLVASRVTP